MSDYPTSAWVTSGYGKKTTPKSDAQTSQSSDLEHDHFIVRTEVYEGIIDGLGSASDDVLEYLDELYPACDECGEDDDE